MVTVRRQFRVPPPNAPGFLIVRYDGPALAGHRMDVADLAPALLGLSELCKIANAKFNGDTTAIKVLIGADQEQKCFQFSLDIVQTIWQQAQAFIDSAEVKSAQDILKWLGLGGTSGGGLYGLFRLIKWLAGKKVSGEKFFVQDGKNVVQLSVPGSNNTVNTYVQTYELLKDGAAIESAKRVIEPVVREGYDKVEFEVAGEICDRFEKNDAKLILEHELADGEEVPLGDPQTTTAYVRVYAPVYDPAAPKWRFMYNDAHPYMDISGTTIAADAIRRGGAFVNDLYEVKLETQQFKAADGKITAAYKIKDVLSFSPARVQYQEPLLPDETKGD